MTTKVTRFLIAVRQWFTTGLAERRVAAIYWGSFLPGGNGKKQRFLIAYTVWDWGCQQTRMPLFAQQSTQDEANACDQEQNREEKLFEHIHIYMWLLQ